MEVPIARPERWACFACCCPRPTLEGQALVPSRMRVPPA